MNIKSIYTSKLNISYKTNELKVIDKKCEKFE